MIPQPNYQFKFVLIGDSSVGKSSILNRFVDDQFHDNLLATIGVDFKFRKMKVNNDSIKIQIWDTAGLFLLNAGQETFRSLVSAYYHSADAILVVYDLTAYKSFESVVDYWLKEAQNNNKNNACIFLFGNKVDSNQKNVQKYLVQAIVEKHNVDKYFEVSAKTGQKIQQSFVQICNILIAKNKGNKPTSGEKNNLGSNFKVGDSTLPTQQQNKKKCC